MPDKDVLDSWKEIAEYLGRSEKTCRRLEKELGLPVHRLEETPKARVYAYKDEIDLWKQKTQHSEEIPLTSRTITVSFGLNKLLVPALVFIGIVIIGVIIWQLLPEKEPYLAPKIENSIAVISFENQTGDVSYDYLKKAIPNLLITNLENTGLLYVVTWERMHDLLKQMDKGNVEVIDRDLGFELCRREGIESIVLGSFIKAGEVFATDIKVLDVESKKLLKSASTKGKEVDSILESQIDELSKEISLNIGIAKQKIDEARIQVVNVTSSSLEAYNYYLRGKEAYAKQYYYKAQKLYEKAVKLDPKFASAHLELCRANSKLGNKKAMVESLKKAKDFSEEATEKERLYIEAIYALRIEDNTDKRFNILKQIVEKYPRDKLVHCLLANHYTFRRGMYQEGILEYKKALDLDPHYRTAMSELGLTYRLMNNYEKAIEILERYASLFPEDADPYDVLGRVYFSMGRLDDSIAKIKKALEIKPDYYFSLLAIHQVYSFKENYSEALKWVDQFISRSSAIGVKAIGYVWKGFYHYWLGGYAQSIKYFTKAAELAEEVGMKGLISLESMKAWVYYDRGELQLSRKQYKSDLDDLEDVLPKWFILALLDLKQGNLDSAKSRKASTESEYLQEFLRGEILLSENSYDRAIKVLEEMLDMKDPTLDAVMSGVGYHLLNHREILARAYTQKGDANKAIFVYEQLTTFNPNSIDRRLINPINYYRLGKLYEQIGQNTKAIEHYQKFLELWKDADPGLTEVDDAREKLEGLKQ